MPFTLGQRWISDTESELGLGTVVAVDARTVTLLFPSTGENRLYARSDSPVTRVMFNPGDTITSHDGWQRWLFVGIGVNKAFNAEAGPLIAVCMGVITGVGGGIIRDVLAREIPMILRTEIYATACIIGGIVHATAYYTFSVPLETASMMGMVVTLLIRLAAIRWHLKLPTFALDENGR